MPNNGVGVASGQTLDVTKMSDEELYKYLQLIAGELERRHAQNQKTPVP